MNKFIDNFWLNNPVILINEFYDLIPNPQKDVIQSLNALTRIFIIIGIYYMNIIVILFGFALTYYIYTKIINKDMNDKGKELYKNSDSDSDSKSNCNIPTKENPVGNIMPADPVDKIGTCVNDETNEIIKNNVKLNLYADINDVWNKKHSEFYTMPSTTIPNNRDEFMQWCYNSNNYSCRDGDMENCLQSNSIKLNG
jgi:hypothetical protein